MVSGALNQGNLETQLFHKVKVNKQFKQLSDYFQETVKKYCNLKKKYINHYLVLNCYLSHLLCNTPKYIMEKSLVWKIKGSYDLHFSSETSELPDTNFFIGLDDI